jgi:hypothetical protein
MAVKTEISEISPGKGKTPRAPKRTGLFPEALHVCRRMGSVTTQKMQGNKDSWIEILQKADTIDDIRWWL